jgi:hypothetical protein
MFFLKMFGKDTKKLQSMYPAADDHTLVLYLQSVTATFYSFAGEPWVLTF